jgi:hypothetical protein
MSTLTLLVRWAVPIPSVVDGTALATLNAIGVADIVGIEGATKLPVPQPKLSVNTERDGDALPPQAMGRTNRRRATTGGYRMPKPGERMFDYAMRAMQMHPAMDLSTDMLAKAIHKLGYTYGNPKKTKSSLGSVTASLRKLGLIETTDQRGYYRITDDGRKCPIPVPYTHAGLDLRPAQ